MKICFFNPVFDRRLDSVDRLQDTYWHVFHLASALAGAGHDVEVIQAFGESLEFDYLGVRVHALRATSRTAAGNKHTDEVSDYNEALQRLDQIQPEILHVFGVTLLEPLRTVQKWSKQNGGRISTSFHGGSPSRSPFVRWRQKSAFRQVAAAFFSADQYANEWRASGVLASDTRVTVAPEVCSPFTGVDRDMARQNLGVTGQPVFGWSGRLHPVKDPLTALRGFQQVLASAPEAEFLMAFQSSELLPQVQDFLADHPQVAARVRLLGQIEHSQMEVLFSAADFFVATSLREFGSNALVEALSCGCIPLLTDIPSFRQLTRDIPSAQLFPVGAANELSTATEALLQSDLETLAARVQDAYREHLSYAVLGGTYSGVFESL